MHPIIRVILGIFAGVILGAIVNYALIMTGHYLVPPPEGSDFTTEEGLAAGMELMETKHFIMPFFAHAIGTLVGAFIAAKIAKSPKPWAPLIVGAAFFYGGLSMVLDYPSPMWFNVLDLGLAYIPMALLGFRWARS